MLVETAPALDLAVAVVAQSAGVMRTAAVGLRAGTDGAPYRHSVVRTPPVDMRRVSRDESADARVWATVSGDLVVESAWGAVPMLPSLRFRRPLAEPAVCVSTERALHGVVRQVGCAAIQGLGIVLPL